MVTRAVGIGVIVTVAVGAAVLGGADVTTGDGVALFTCFHTA